MACLVLAPAAQVLVLTNAAGVAPAGLHLEQDAAWGPPDLIAVISSPAQDVARLGLCAAVVPPRSNVHIDFALRHVELAGGVVSPAKDFCSVGQAAGVVLPNAHLLKASLRGDELTLVVEPPADHCAIGSYTTAVEVAKADLSEEPIGWNGLLSGVQGSMNFIVLTDATAPALDHASGQQAAGLVHACRNLYPVDVRLNSRVTLSRENAVSEIVGLCGCAGSQEAE